MDVQCYVISQRSRSVKLQFQSELLSLLTGAGRLELCSSLLEGGLTPTLGEHSSVLYRYSYLSIC